jgi:hypothetical protein
VKGGRDGLMVVVENHSLRRKEKTKKELSYSD